MEVSDKDFTFCVLCYNHEKYICEHLESIKYQIINYGQTEKNHLLICDDSSKDSTIAIIGKWISQNDLLFETVRILSSETNQGTVKNYITALRNIHTKRFKILAGDDLYYINNIYEIGENGTVMITPTIKLGEDIACSLTWHYYKLSTCNNAKKFIKNYLKHKNFLEAPGIFIGENVITEDLISFIGKYKLIEDAPEWHYLANDGSTVFKFIDKPYIIYRLGSGVSTKGKRSLPESYLSDKNLLQNEVFIYQKNILLRFYSKVTSAFHAILYLTVFRNRKRVGQLERNMNSCVGPARAHLEYINENINKY